MASMKELQRRPAKRMPEKGSYGGKKFTSREKNIDVTGRNSHEMAKRFSGGGKRGKGDRW